MTPSDPTDRPARPGPALVVHAGAWDLPLSEREAHRAACLTAVRAGWDVLRGGGRAVDAVQTAVMAMEDDPAINAGRGAVLNRDGDVELDAGLMDGGPLRIGAVACVRDVANPIRLAAALLPVEEVLLVGAGASAYARASGVETCDPASLIVRREQDRLAACLAAADRHSADRSPDDGPPDGPGDTVGAVALDLDAHLAAGTSTGGRPGKPAGRVGDAPLPGCGFFADDDLGAAVSTGWGEHVVRALLARRTADLLRETTAQDACWLAMRELEFRLNGRAGVIALSPSGSIGFGFNTPAMPVAYMDGDMAEPIVGGIPKA